MVKSVKALLLEYVESALSETKREKSTPAILKVHGIKDCVEYISSMSGVSDLEILSTHITCEGEDYQGYGYTENRPCLALACNYDNENFWRLIRNNIGIFGYPALNARESGIRYPKKYVSKEQLYRYIFEESEFKKLDEYCRILMRYARINGQQSTNCEWGVQGWDRKNYYIKFNLVDLLILYVKGPDAANDFRRFKKYVYEKKLKSSQQI